MTQSRHLLFDTFRVPGARGDPPDLLASLRIRPPFPLSQGLEILDERSPVRIVHIRPELVAGIRVAWQPRVEDRGTRKGATGFIAYSDRIEVPVAHVEDLAALRRRGKQLAQIGDRSIVQIGGRRPDSIERAGAIFKQSAELVRPSLIDLRGEPGIVGRLRDPLRDNLLGDHFSRHEARYLGRAAELGEVDGALRKGRSLTRIGADLVERKSFDCDPIVMFAHGRARGGVLSRVYDHMATGALFPIYLRTECHPLRVDGPEYVLRPVRRCQIHYRPLALGFTA
jgi:hypothetical protein